MKVSSNNGKKSVYIFLERLGFKTFLHKVHQLIKLIYSEQATSFCEISTLLLTGTTQDKSKVEISQNFVAFSEYMNFKPKSQEIPPCNVHLLHYLTQDVDIDIQQMTVCCFVDSSCSTSTKQGRRKDKNLWGQVKSYFFQKLV